MSFSARSQDVQTHFGLSGDIDLIGGVGSVIGQEGEQNGFLSTIAGQDSKCPPIPDCQHATIRILRPTELCCPRFCGNLNAIDLQIFDPLTVVTTNIKPHAQTLTFRITPPAGIDISLLSITYINQQNLPVNEKIQNVQRSGNTVTFEALFPFDEPTFGALFGNGLTIAAVTNITGPFTSADEVALVTVFGPGLIEIK